MRLGKWRFYKTSWTQGTLFTWNDFRFNSGRPYTYWRFGPIMIQRFDK